MKIGVDIVDLRRLDITNRHFVERILTPNELLVFDNKATSTQKREYLGGRFAGKEAVMKALKQMDLWKMMNYMKLRKF